MTICVRAREAVDFHCVTEVLFPLFLSQSVGSVVDDDMYAVLSP